MSDSTPTKPKRVRGRSPAYPAIGLDKAVQKVRQLYAKDKQYPVPVATVAPTWGYANLNGPAALQVSALKKFGLVHDAGSKDERTIAVSDLAVQILNHPAEDAREAAIKEAALRPPIHREMWEQYGADLPSAATLEWRLTRDRGFTETGAKEFIREYQDTIAFSKLGSEDATATLSEGEPALRPENDADDEPRQRSALMERALENKARHEARIREEEEREERESSAIPQAAGMTAVPIPLPGGGAITVQAAFPISEANWTYWQAVLTAMKPGLVATAESGGSPEPQDV